MLHARNYWKTKFGYYVSIHLDYIGSMFKSYIQEDDLTSESSVAAHIWAVETV